MLACLFIFDIDFDLRRLFSSRFSPSLSLSLLHLYFVFENSIYALIHKFACLADRVARRNERQTHTHTQTHTRAHNTTTFLFFYSRTLSCSKQSLSSLLAMLRQCRTTITRRRKEQIIRKKVRESWHNFKNCKLAWVYFCVCVWLLPDCKLQLTDHSAAAAPHDKDVPSLSQGAGGRAGDVEGFRVVQNTHPDS